MKYKIQVTGVAGWADLKYTDDNGKTFKPDIYDTKAEAEEELASIKHDIPDFEGRVVTEDTEPEGDLY